MRTGREGGVCSGKTCMRPRVSSILGFPEEKLKREVEKEEDSVCSSSETILLELHIAAQLKYHYGYQFLLNFKPSHFTSNQIKFSNYLFFLFNNTFVLN